MSIQTAVREATSLSDFEGAVVHNDSFNSRTLSTCYSIDGKNFNHPKLSDTFELSPVKYKNHDLYTRSATNYSLTEVALPSQVSSSSFNGNSTTSNKSRFVSRCVMSVCQDKKRIDLTQQQAPLQGTPIIKPSDIGRDIIQDVPIEKVRACYEEAVLTAITSKEEIKVEQSGILSKQRTRPLVKKDTNKGNVNKGLDNTDNQESALSKRRRFPKLEVNTQLKPTNSTEYNVILNQVEGPAITNLVQDSCYVSRSNYLCINMR